MSSRKIRALVSELLGSFTIAAAVVGSGILAQNMTDDKAVMLIINTIGTVFGLAIAISIFSQVGLAHFNPIVTLVFWIQKKISATLALGYFAFQLLGGALGAILANLMFDHPAILASSNIRSGTGIFLGEIVASFGLVFLILMAIRIGKEVLSMPESTPKIIGS